VKWRVRIQFDLSDEGKGPNQPSQQYLFNSISLLLNTMGGVKNAAIGIEDLEEGE